ncbi:hypothetical protein WJX72_004023 [[Myrmecia] bisecta]|uniref:Response regulatory domain-containing protein n=1 Tax=[Myrmecia] bisecta TaxID=41462 RepID=A0AAW1Q2X7_9CHLO
MQQSEEARTDSWDNFPAGLKVLVVDDDPLCLKVVEHMLRRCNYAVTTCFNGTIALERLRDRHQHYDLVLSDVYMPDMDGFKLLETIGLELGVPVIMMSSNGETNVVLRGVTHGAVDFLIKPVRIEELRNVWQHVVRRRRDQARDSIDEDGEDPDDTSKRGDKKRKERRDSEDDGGQTKKPRVIWSVEMHGQFVNAVNQLGVDKAVPKRILDLMNVEGLTRENVASHLQKYRLYLKRVAGVQMTSGRTKSGKLPAESSYPMGPMGGAGMHLGMGLIAHGPVSPIQGMGMGMAGMPDTRDHHLMQIQLNQMGMHAPHMGMGMPPGPPLAGSGGSGTAALAQSLQGMGMPSAGSTTSPSNMHMRLPPAPGLNGAQLPLNLGSNLGTGMAANMGANLQQGAMPGLGHMSSGPHYGPSHHLGMGHAHLGGGNLGDGTDAAAYSMMGLAYGNQGSIRPQAGSLQQYADQGVSDLSGQDLLGLRETLLASQQAAVAGGGELEMQVGQQRDPAKSENMEEILNYFLKD